MATAQKLKFIIVCLCAAIVSLSTACYRTGKAPLAVMTAILVLLLVMNMAIFLRIRKQEVKNETEDRSAAAPNPQEP